MAYTIIQVEDKLVAVMKADAGLSAACKTIDSFSGEAADLVDQIEQMTALLPAVWAVFGGSIFTESANRSFDDEMRFIILVAAQNLRSRAAAAHGVYEILELLKGLLTNNNLGFNIEPLHPISIDPIAVTNRLAIYGVTFKTLFSLD